MNLAAAILHCALPLILVWIAKPANGCAAGGGGGGGGDSSSNGGTNTGGQGLRGILGGDITASAYNGGGNANDRVKVDSDLFCDNADGCNWRNAQDDRLDWATVDGKPDPEKWSFATGTKEMYNPKAFVLASNPRAAEDQGELVSAPIGCQNGDGELSFKHWISRARKEGTAPTLDACWRFVGETTLRDCLRVTNANPGPSNLFIPGPIEGPFELVLRGQNFVATPEGGFIVLDDIRYTAPVIDDDVCPLGPTEGPTTPITTTRQPDAVTTPPSGPDNVQACRAITCPISLNEQFCGYNPLGSGATGPGLTHGWEVTTGERNTNANALTGVRFDKNNLRTEPFGLADFPDPRKVEVNPNTKFTLQTGQQVEFSQDVYLKFHRYLATQGVRLSVCRDAGARDCIYDSPPLGRGSEAAGNRRWVEEVVRVPRGAPSDLFFVAQYDATRRYNAGQVGLSDIQVVDSAGGGRSLC